MRARRHEQRVKKIGIPVQRRVAGAKRDLELVRPLAKRRRLDDDVAVHGAPRHVGAVRTHLERGRFTALPDRVKIEYER